MKPQSTSSSSAVQQSDIELFYKNAFLFLHHRDAILSDPRLFYVPVPFRNGLAYTGYSGLSGPTLGVYVKWWMACSPTLVVKDGKKVLVCQFGGSPLSGSNQSVVVDQRGAISYMQIVPFLPLWSTMMKIIRDSRNAQDEAQPYTLTQAVEILKSTKGESIPLEQDIDCIFKRPSMPR